MVKKLEVALTEWQTVGSGPTTNYTVYKSHMGYVFVPSNEAKSSLTMTQADAEELAKMVTETSGDQS